MIGLAVAVARLVWAIATPVGPLGTWQPRQPVDLPVGARLASFARFDPFYRTAPDDDGAQAVTSLPLKLMGVRINEATGLGSAIIATPDDVQTSYAVGDEITGGARLKAVAIDHVVIDKGGADELLYLDQSEPAPTPVPTPTLPAAAEAAATATATADLPKTDQ
ncbi:type II secretion system protein N [Hephaestia caeni]|uniref:type II secretion system protein N n=1 Tax=Hephaestia caeni TaxID=645617 RepID=UPI001B86EEBD|nr:type II secretion system protein N [Hephaestia caeni]